MNTIVLASLSLSLALAEHDVPVLVEQQDEWLDAWGDYIQGEEQSMRGLPYGD